MNHKPNIGNISIKLTKTTPNSMIVLNSRLITKNSRIQSEGKSRKEVHKRHYQIQTTIRLEMLKALTAISQEVLDHTDT